MNSAKRTTIAACTLFIMLGFVAGGVSQLIEYEASQKNADTSEASSSVTDIEKPEEEIAETPPDKYVLKIEDGILVVYNERDMLRPIIVTDIYASTLRHHDRAQLTMGVVANDDFELQTMLEDFSS